MDFTLCEWVRDSTRSAASKLCLTGEIRAGDTQRLLELIRSDHVNVYTASRMVSLDSRGGDVREAMSLAKVLGALYPFVYVEKSCASSCLLLYLSAAYRVAVHGGRVGMHRPTFESSYLQGLPVAEAKREYAAAETEFHNYVTGNGLPESLYERLMATASTTVDWLSAADLRLIGVNPPYLQEKILASCGTLVPKAEGDITASAANRFFSCFNNLVDDERLKFVQSVAIPEEKTLETILEKALKQKQ
jgi:ATP-dependent protease ClpP protease subunit